jgi:hypothetical protein
MAKQQKLYIDEAVANKLLEVAFGMSDEQAMPAFYLLVTALIEFARAIDLPRDRLIRTFSDAVNTSYLIETSEVEADKCQPN